MAILYVGSMVVGLLLIVTGFVLFFVTDPGVQDPGGQLGSMLWLRFVTFPLGLGLMAFGGNGLRRSKHGKATHKTKTADEELRVYESADSHSPLIAKLPEGTDIEFGPVTEVNGVDWVNVKFADGNQGYVIGHAGVLTVMKAVVEKNHAGGYEFADFASPPAFQLPPGTELEIVKGDWDNAPYDQAVPVRAWVDGKKMHIKSNTKVKWL